MTADAPDDRVVVRDASKFYGEVLGVNRVRLEIPPGITSLVGPNGSGKTTLMSLMAGLLRPTRGSITVKGIPTDDPVRLGKAIGYCTQFDAFPPGLTGLEFVTHALRIRGVPRREAETAAAAAIERVNLSDAAGRRVAAYSKGMRQRIRLAQAIAHDPRVRILDEPLNGLDPIARSEVIALFQEWGREGRHVILSSHILHEVDILSDRVVLIHHGYVVADGAIDRVGVSEAAGRRIAGYSKGMNPGYWRDYRSTHPKKAQRNRMLQLVRNRKRLRMGADTTKVDGSKIAKVDASEASHFKPIGLFYLIPVIAKVDASKVFIQAISSG